jgi:hypothetical protein
MLRHTEEACAGHFSQRAWGDPKAILPGSQRSKKNIKKSRMQMRKNIKDQARNGQGNRC